MAWQTRHSTHLEQSQREVLQDEEGFQSLALYEALKDYWMGRHRRHGSGDLVHSLCWKVSKNCRQACRERDINTNKKSSQMTTSRWYKRTLEDHKQPPSENKWPQRYKNRECAHMHKTIQRKQKGNIRKYPWNGHKHTKYILKVGKKMQNVYNQIQTITNIHLLYKVHLSSCSYLMH